MPILGTSVLEQLVADVTFVAASMCSMDYRFVSLQITRTVEPTMACSALHLSVPFLMFGIHRLGWRRYALGPLYTWMHTRDMPPNAWHIFKCLAARFARCFIFGFQFRMLHPDMARHAARCECDIAVRTILEFSSLARMVCFGMQRPYVRIESRWPYKSFPTQFAHMHLRHYHIFVRLSGMVGFTGVLGRFLVTSQLFATRGHAFVRKNIRYMFFDLRIIWIIQREVSQSICECSPEETHFQKSIYVILE